MTSHQVTSPSPLSKGLHSEGRHLSRHLGQPCGCWGVPCAICSPVLRAGSTAGCQLAQPVCSSPDQRRLQPVSFPGFLGACPSGSSSLCCQEFGAASGSGSRQHPCQPGLAQQGRHFLLLVVSTSKPSPVPPTSTTPHLWQLQDAVKHFST